MNPDKLFDYLDGNLPPSEREQLEAALVSDERLQRELSIARQIHKGMTRSREVVVAPDPHSPEGQRGAVLGRRVATAFAGLVVLNVFIGLYLGGRAFVAEKEKRKSSRTVDTAMREQVTNSMQKAAGSMLNPAPIGMEELTITAPAGARDEVAGRIILLAERFGGSATRGLTNAEAATVIVDVPGDREAEFREGLRTVIMQNPPAPPNATMPPINGNSAAEKKSFRIQIVNAVTEP
jgi:hypothetical protein